MSLPHLDIKPVDIKNDLKMHYTREQDPQEDLANPEISMIQTFREAVLKYGSLPFCQWRAGMCTNPSNAVDELSSMTYQDAINEIERIASGLRVLGLAPGARVAIYARNSPLWILSAFAVFACGYVLLPCYDTLGPSNIKYAMHLTSVEVVITQEAYLPTMIGIAHQLPRLRGVVMMDQTPSPQKIAREAATAFAEVEGGVTVPGYTQTELSFITVGAKSRVSADPLTPDTELAPMSPLPLRPYIICEPTPLVPAGEGDGVLPIQQLAALVESAPAYTGDTPVGPDAHQCMVFTSGSSGDPKGVVHSSRSLLSSIRTMSWRTYPVHASSEGTQHVMISYLPLSHIYELGLEFTSVTRGHCIAYSSGDTKMLLKDLELIRPTVLPGVPRVYVKIHNAVLKQLEASGVKRAAFKSAVATKKLYLKLNKKAREFCRSPVDGIFKAVRSKLGGRVEHMFSASAALPKDTADFLRIACCANLVMGFGASETAACGTLSLPYFTNTEGLLGYIRPGMEGRVLARPEVEDIDILRGQGELLLRGPFNGLCYYPDVPLTDEDGWYHTGDLVRMEPDGRITYLSRASNVVKTQTGEFISIELIEQVLVSSPLFNQVFVYAEPSSPYPAAAVVVNRAALDLRTQEGEDPLTVALAECKAVCKTGKLRGYMVPRAVVLTEEEWTPQNGLLSPAMKPKRGELKKRFRTELLAAMK
eukprot:gnl/Dysnectes_brevis/1910_a2192_1008.p1 GENE.gnl/Dysnectes_brevis/1910_a2192_1008~~gnl/Dysnectes_brevis/1910_a2192_1008.p1  ORF type:complete len:703 (-),score=250.38 gnl/Dysnectes_brevis/1910_a2192_1008:2254-4362(-)